jgi:hypothetical protein
LIVAKLNARVSLRCFIQIDSFLNRRKVSDAMQLSRIMVGPC